MYCKNHHLNGLFTRILAQKVTTDYSNSTFSTNNILAIALTSISLYEPSGGLYLLATIKVWNSSRLTNSCVIFDYEQLGWPSGKSAASGAVDLGLIPSRVKQMTFEIGIYRFSAWRSAVQWENKPASLLVPLGRALSEIPPPWCGR